MSRDSRQLCWLLLFNMFTTRLDNFFLSFGPFPSPVSSLTEVKRCQLPRKHGVTEQDAGTRRSDPDERGNGFKVSWQLGEEKESFVSGQQID